MKDAIRLFTSAVLLLAFIAVSCSSDDDSGTDEAVVTEFPEQGLLGQPVTIKLQHVKFGMLQVFFDDEKAPVGYLSETEIEVIVPRSITGATPLLKIIDLESNTTILSEVFSLKTPVISSYNQNEVIFGQALTISGENFDELADDVSVTVNNQPAAILETSYNHIIIEVPNAITDAGLVIKVNAQRQEVTSPLPLQLKAPVISGIENSEAWITGQLVINGENFNPSAEHGEILVDGIQCYFTATNTAISIDVPPGPFREFAITNITYTTAGLTASYAGNIPIMNNSVTVDYFDDINLPHTIFTHQDKAYALVYHGSSTSPDTPVFSFMVFSPGTEKWAALPGFSHNGYIADAVYDGEDTVYLYKNNGNGTYSLSKLNMNTLAETPVSLPYGNQILNPILFAYQDSLYMLSGLHNNNGQITVLTGKYKYSESTNSWSELPDSAFSEIPFVSNGGSGKSEYVHVGNDLYINRISSGTYKISPGLTVTPYPYSVLFEYDGAVFGKHVNTNSYLSNVNTQAQIEMDFDDLGWRYFTLNDEVYFIKNSWTVYYQNTMYTNKLKKEILNDIL